MKYDYVTIKVRHWENGLSVDVSPGLLRKWDSLEWFLRELCGRMNFKHDETVFELPDGKTFTFAEPLAVE